VDVNLAHGETATLECDFERPKSSAYGFWAVAGLVALLLGKVGLYRTGLAAYGLCCVWTTYLSWRNWMTPGGYLFLRSRAEGQLPDFLRSGAEQDWANAGLRRAWQRPRITIRRLMLLMAALGVLFGVAVQERRIQRRADIEAKRVRDQIRRDMYRDLAQREAESERFWRKMEAASADSEAHWMKRVEGLLESIRVASQRDSSDLREILAVAQQALATERTERAKCALNAGHASQSKQRYLDAAERPAESVDDFP
jgi:hypothetical protein